MTTPHHTPDLFALSEIHGPVLRPGDPAYADEVTGFNLAALHTPDVVVGATSPDDIVTAMRWAKATNTPVAVQATGHGPWATGHGANFPIEKGLLIDTARMTDAQIDPTTRTATIAAGAKWSHVMAAAAPHGLAGLCGTSTDAGVIGYTLGGGLPVLGRAYGYAADLVRCFQVVTPDGRPRETDPQNEPELFWALRGGKGNVGVVTSLVTELLPLPPSTAAASTARANTPRPCSGPGWTGPAPSRTRCAARSRSSACRPSPRSRSPCGGFWARVAIAWPGLPAEGEALIAPLRAAAPVAVDTVEVMDHASLDRIHVEPQDPLPARESCLLLRDLPPDAIRSFLDQVGPAAGVDHPLLMVEIRHMGGAMSRPSPVEDAVCARDAQYVLDSVGILAAPPAAEAIEQATHQLYTAMAPYGTGRTMVNIHGTPGDEQDRARAWTPEVYERLRHDKATYDPANLLRYGHAVTPA